MSAFLFHTLAGWLGITGLIVAGALAVAYFIAPLRPYALAVIGTALAAAVIYARGSRDRAALEQRRKDEAVRKNQEAYDAIEKRPDSPDDVIHRLGDGSF